MLCASCDSTASRKEVSSQSTQLRTSSVPLSGKRVHPPAEVHSTSDTEASRESRSALRYYCQDLCSQVVPDVNTHSPKNWAMALDCLRSDGDSRSSPQAPTLLPAPACCSLIDTSAVAAAMQAFAACRSPLLKVNVCDIAALRTQLAAARRCTHTVSQQDQLLNTPCLR